MLRWIAGVLVLTVAGVGALALQAAWHADDPYPFAGRTLSIVVWDIPAEPGLPSPLEMRDSVQASLPQYSAFLRDWGAGPSLCVGSEEGPPDVHAVARAIGPALVAPHDLSVGVAGESAPDLFDPGRREHDIAWLAAGLLIGAVCAWWIIRRPARAAALPS